MLGAPVEFRATAQAGQGDAGEIDPDSIDRLRGSAREIISADNGLDARHQRLHHLPIAVHDICYSVLRRLC
jgi:hypothetical protein